MMTHNDDNADVQDLRNYYSVIKSMDDAYRHLGTPDVIYTIDGSRLPEIRISNPPVRMAVYYRKWQSIIVQIHEHHNEEVSILWHIKSDHEKKHLEDGTVVF
jgi:hypothetical protein